MRSKKHKKSKRQQLLMLTLAIVTLGAAVLRDIVPAHTFLSILDSKTAIDYIFTTVSGLLCTAVED